jgi:hypothetical protein
VITPRVTRLLRAPDLRALQHAIVANVPREMAAREMVVLVPTRSAAEELRRTLEDAVFEAGPGSAFVLPDLLTRGEWYGRLHERLAGAPPMLTGFEREVLLRLSADDAAREGAEAPFHLRPGLIAAILEFYDDLRRRSRTIDSFDRHVRGALEAGRDSDRGAARLLRQTQFLAATFAAFERRTADSGRIDEHALRAQLLSLPVSPAYCHVVVAVADQAADARGLWPADFDLLSRMPGVERLDVVATERMLAAGWYQRLHDALPGFVEERAADAGAPPVLLAPHADPPKEPTVAFTCRDREEELVDAARWIKRRSRDADRIAPPLERTAIVFQRPLPYLYLARHVFGAANVPYQASDSLPLAAEPFAAALDLLLVAISEDATRAALIGLLSSPQWTFIDPGSGAPIERGQTSALDRVLRDAKFLGGWERLGEFAVTLDSPAPGGRRESAFRQRARPALAAALAIAPDVAAFRNATAASEQIARLLEMMTRLERLPGPRDQGYERHMRGRAAILGALAGLREAHARYDDRPLPVAELVATLRRWIEGQTFAPRTGDSGILLLDAHAAALARVDSVRLVGLVESDWPERGGGNIFYPPSLLRELGRPSDADRLTAARARFQDLLFVASRDVSVSTFTLEEDALVAPSPFLEVVGASGLVMVREAEPPFARIFTHEALALQPVAGDAVSGAASGWLRLRMGRTLSGDPRFHGAIGQRVPEVYAVSRVERYLECPFKYFAGYVLDLDEEREDESGLTPQERGQLLHGVFEAFFEAWSGNGFGAVTAENLDQALALFAAVAETRLQMLPEGDRALERTYLLGSAASPGLAGRAFAFEIEQGTPVVERLLEYGFEGSFRFEGPDGPRRISVRGKADRIDLLADDTIRVVDYKLGRAPKPARALQLPIYGVCAQQHLEERRAKRWPLARAGYVAFKEKNAFVDLGGKSGNVDAALREGQQRFIAAVDRIEDGEFPPDPDEPWTCTRCGFPHVCRKDYVGDE